MQTRAAMAQAAGLDSRVAQAERESTVLVTLIVLCLFALPMNAFAAVRMPLYALILVLEALLLVVTNVSRINPKVDMPLFALSAGLFAYLLFCWFMNGGDATERLLQTVLYLLTVISLSRVDWSNRRLILLRHAFTILMFACLVYWALASRVTNYYSAFYLHGNGFGNVCFAALVFFFISSPAAYMEGHSRVGTAVPCVVALLLMTLANSRSAYLALIVFTICLFLLRAIGKKHSIRNVSLAFFGVALAGVLLFSIVYPSLLGTDLGMKLELLSREVFNKNFFSGREEVWGMVLGAIKGHELFGLGLAMTPSDVYSTTYSSHNLYLQTLLQSGALGLCLIVAVLLLILHRITWGKTWSAYVGSALIVALLVHECFEVALTQNNFTYGLMYWALLAIALSRSRSELILMNGN